MRALAILLAFGHLVGCLVAAWFMWFLAVFPWENQEPEQERLWDPVFIGTAVVVAVLGLTTFVAVAVGRRRWAIPVVAVDLGVGVAVLAFALGESAHSDGKLVGFALLVELPAIASVALLERHRGIAALA